MKHVKINKNYIKNKNLEDLLEPMTYILRSKNNNFIIKHKNKDVYEFDDFFICIDVTKIEKLIFLKGMDAVFLYDQAFYSYKCTIRLTTIKDLRILIDILNLSTEHMFCFHGYIE